MLNNSDRNRLMTLACDVIKQVLMPDGNDSIDKAYNRQIAAFPVTVSMSGLKPAFAIYWADRNNNDDDKCKVDRSKIIDMLALMDFYEGKSPVKDGMALKNVVFNENNDEEEKDLRRRIIGYSIALKLAIRTFKLVDTNE